MIKTHNDQISTLRQVSMRFWNVRGKMVDFIHTTEHHEAVVMVDISEDRIEATGVAASIIAYGKSMMVLRRIRVHQEAPTSRKMFDSALSAMTKVIMRKIVN